ncbi:MAG: methyltransferase, FkbM family [Firmicutes bacterium]|nr:methyltransferase, FkbM family [Bacillota bacterium]
MQRRRVVPEGRRGRRGRGRAPDPVPGRPDLIQLNLPPRAAAAVGRPFFVMRGQADATIVPYIRMTGSWEPYLMELIADKLPVGGTFVDVGANIGIHSMLAALRVGPTGKVFAIEASPGTWQVLAENLVSTGCPGAIAVLRGVWDAPAVLTFCHVPENHGHSHLSTTGYQRGQTFAVACESLDSLVAQAQLSRIDLIKIDVEGSETKVWQGAQDTLQRFKPPVILEMNFATLRDNVGSSALELYQAIGASGYNMKAVMPDFTLIPISDFSEIEAVIARGFPVFDLLCEHSG